MGKVAIYQNTISFGGRIRVIATMTECFNKMGIIPDWFAYRSSFDSKQLNEIHSVPIQANIKIINVWNKGMAEYKYIKLNKIMSKISTDYDLVLNSNNVLSGINNLDKFLHYIHFPREARVLTAYRNSVYSYRLIDYFFDKMFKSYFNKANVGLGMMVNSKFTQKAVADAYGFSEEMCQVLYPPISINEMQKSKLIKDGNAVISVGRFSQEKNQLMQIKIAETLPQLTFNICGYAPNKSSNKYFHDCVDYINRKSIKNVILNKNMSADALEDKHKKAKYFLHTMEEEPFGISTVEAILNGCIPIVHNSGGSAEIVENEKLLFNTENEAIESFNYIMSLNEQLQDKVQNDLRGQLDKYNESHFKDSFNKIIKKIIRK
jgi:glycosyltransferase involved in cell wall biosynthesis